ncbi:MAG: hypothetical protein ACOC33_01050 [bacterium]
MEDIFKEQNRLLCVANRISGIPKNLSDKKQKPLSEEDNTRRMVKKMRKVLSEQEETSMEPKNLKTTFDQKREEDKFENNIKDLNVVTEFIDLKVTPEKVFWGGTVDGIIQFVYKVTPDDETSGVEFNYLDGFIVDDPENDKIIDRIETYYDTFYKYWRNNVLQN